MFKTAFRPSAFVLTSLVVLAAAPAFARQAAEPAPPVAAPVSPAPQPAPQTVLSKSVADHAAAYMAYVSAAKKTPAKFKSGSEIQTALKLDENFKPEALARGVVAYATIIALEEPSFVDSLRSAAVDPTARREILAKIYADPAYAMTLPGASTAAGEIAASLSLDSYALSTTGAKVKQSAYDMQKNKWSKLTIEDRDGRLAAAKRMAEAPMEADEEDSAKLLQAALAGKGVPVRLGKAVAPYADGTAHAIALAALAVLGEAGDANRDWVDAMLTDGVSQRCFKMSKLDLFQCLAVAKPNYEDAFCLGQHVLMDTGTCISKAGGRVETAALVAEPGPVQPVHAAHKKKSRRHKTST